MVPLNIPRMKSLAMIAMVLFLIKPSCAKAEESEITSRSVLKFTAGVITAFSIHEASHALVAGITDTDLDWEFGNYNQPIAFTEKGTSDSKGFALYSAGLVSQLIGSEIILRKDKIDKNDAFVRGMMAWNILNPILYSLDYWVIRRSNRERGNTYQGDMEGIEHYSSDSAADGFALSMAGIAAYQGYRFLKTQPWAPDWLKGESYSLYLEPQPYGGLAFRVEFPF
jgi:hypothetical protein